MPKLVDHAQKRLEIIQATWRLVATRGFEAATMREIAAEAGYANGALSHYFSSKEEILRASYLFVWEETNIRIAKRLNGETGLDAVRIYWEEISPSADLTRLEAKIVLPFFARAATDPDLAEVTSATLDQWRDELRVHLVAAREQGQIARAVSIDMIVEHLMNMLMGLQIHVGIAVSDAQAARHDLILDDYLALIAAPLAG